MKKIELPTCICGCKTELIKHASYEGGDEIYYKIICSDYSCKEIDSFSSNYPECAAENFVSTKLRKLGKI